MKRIFLVLVAIVLLLSISVPALSDSTTPPASELSPNPDYYYGSWTASISPMSTVIAISNAAFNISKASSTSVNVSASTTANQMADTVGGTMYLQKWENDAWTTLRSQGFWGYGTSFHSGSASWTVTSGYYYRLRTVHSAALDGGNASRTTYTGAIFVN